VPVAAPQQSFRSGPRRAVAPPLGWPAADSFESRTASRRVCTGVAALRSSRRRAARTSRHVLAVCVRLFAKSRNDTNIRYDHSHTLCTHAHAHQTGPRLMPRGVACRGGTQPRATLPNRVCERCVTLDVRREQPRPDGSPASRTRRCELPPKPATRWAALQGAAAAAASDPISTELSPRALASPFSMSGTTCLRLQSRQLDRSMPHGQLAPSGAQVLQRGSPRPRLTGQPSLSEDRG